MPTAPRRLDGQRCALAQQRGTDSASACLAIDAPAHPTCRRMRPLRQRGVTGITVGGGPVLPRRVVLREVMRQPDVLMRRCCAGLLDMTALADTGPHVALRGCGHPGHDLDRPAMTRVSQHQG